MNRPAHLPKPLRRTLFVAFALLLAGSAHAEWMQLGRTEGFRVYLDPTLIKRSGDFTQILQLMDFTTAQWADAQTAVGSIKYLIEHDCTQPRSRTLVGEAFSEQMGEGRLVTTERFSNPQWEGVEPGSTAEKIRQIACGKK